MKLSKLLKEVSAFNPRYLKHIKFIVQPFGNPMGKTFVIKFKSNINKAEVENAIKSDPQNLGQLQYQWEQNDLVITKPNNTAITWLFKALDELYGKYGEGMGWDPGSMQEDTSTMSLKSNIDQKWKTADDMAGDMQQWLSSVYASGGEDMYEEVMGILANLADNFDPSDEM